MGDRLTIAVAIAGVLLLMAAARKFIGFKPPLHVTAQTYEVLAAKYRRWETLSLLAGLIFAAAGGASAESAEW